MSSFADSDAPFIPSNANTKAHGALILVGSAPLSWHTIAESHGLRTQKSQPCHSPEQDLYPTAVKERYAPLSKKRQPWSSKQAREVGEILQSHAGSTLQKRFTLRILTIPDPLKDPRTIRPCLQKQIGKTSFWRSETRLCWASGRPQTIGRVQTIPLPRERRNSSLCNKTARECN